MPRDQDRSHAAWHAATAEETLERHEVDRATGLSEEQVSSRRQEFGPNRLREVETRPWWRVLLEQLQSIVVYLLAAAALLALVTGRWPEGIAVVAVIVVNAAIGFASEWKAVRSMAALRTMGEHSTTVRRNGKEIEIAAPQLVPGDIVLLQPGDLAPADLRLVEAEHLRVNEAALTGESVPVDKSVAAVAEDAALAERNSMLYKGTSVADGRAVGVAVATGTATELGRIAELVEQAEGTVTPLQKRLNRLGHHLGWTTVGIAVVVAVLGFFVRRQEATLVVETALALGIAAIPEGLPIVATIALARGMYVMAQRNALVNRLTAVETLGATRVIFTDKTGTLTENRMRLDVVVSAAGELALDDLAGAPAEGEAPAAELELARRVVTVGVLCNQASLDETQGEDNPQGDPTEVALLAGGHRLGILRDQLVDDSPEVKTEAFDPRVKMMATFHEHDGGFLVAVKGAPGAVFEACSTVLGEGGETHDLDDGERRSWSDRADRLAADGLRILAMASKEVSSVDAEPYGELCLLGLTGLLDPPRADVKQAIDSCQAAGIRVAMVTGDQPRTAEAIAAAVGIVGDPEDPEATVMLGAELAEPEDMDSALRDRIHRANIFARVSPEQKLNLMKIYQDRGEIVAMTGDGVNDAPALKKADIGIAMGRRGTEAAKQAADMVLGDDALATIVAAVEQGRVIFANIRSSVMFMLCTNVAEVIAVTVATLAAWTLPLRPLQILYLNVLTDVFPALALGIGPGSGNEMDEPPRDPQESVLTRRHWLEIGGWAILIACTVLASLLLAERWLGLSQPAAVTVSFLTLAFGKLWFSFNLRHPRSPVFVNEITRNPWLWAAIALCAALLLGAVYLPFLSELLQTTSPGTRGWALLLGMSLLPLAVGQLVRLLQSLLLRNTSP